MCSSFSGLARNEAAAGEDRPGASYRPALLWAGARAVCRRRQRTAFIVAAAAWVGGQAQRRRPHGHCIRFPTTDAGVSRHAEDLIPNTVSSSEPLLSIDGWRAKWLRARLMWEYRMQDVQQWHASMDNIRRTEHVTSGFTTLETFRLFSLNKTL